jgi:uncharacterized protein affecting Mg2+/Co2+ transport
MRRILSAVILILVLLPARSWPGGAVSGGVVHLSIAGAGSRYAPGADVVLRYSVPASLGYPWLVLVPADTPHGSTSALVNVYYSSLSLRTRPSGAVTFRAPSEARSWEVRLYDRYSDGKELSYARFDVAEEKVEGTDAAEASLRVVTTRSWVPVNGTFQVEYVAGPGQQGIVALTAPDAPEEFDYRSVISYRTFYGLPTGKLSLRSPKEEGTYELRMYDKDGAVIARVDVRVMR